MLDLQDQSSGEVAMDLYPEVLFNNPISVDIMGDDPQDLAVSLQDIVSSSGTSGTSSFDGSKCVEPLFGQVVSSSSVAISGTGILRAANRKRRLDTSVTIMQFMSMDMHPIPIPTTRAPVTTSA